jgi:hypothetical protein
VVLIENDVDARPFSSQVLSCLPPLPWSVSSEDLANPIRQDLRHLCIFSVDPPGLCPIVVIKVSWFLFLFCNVSSFCFAFSLTPFCG